MGQNGKATELYVQMRIGSGRSELPSHQSPANDDSNLGVLELCVESAIHLPKMDGAFGSCDPYVVVKFAGLEYKTEVCSFNERVSAKKDSSTCARELCIEKSLLLPKTSSSLRMVQFLHCGRTCLSESERRITLERPNSQLEYGPIMTARMLSGRTTRLQIEILLTIVRLSRS